MAKKKDTLKDLNEFMKQQPDHNADEQGFMNKTPTNLAKVEKLSDDIKALNNLPAGSLHEADVASLIKNIANANETSQRQVLFSIIEKVLSVNEDKDGIDIMLLNQVLFLRQHDLIIEKLK